MLQDDCIIPICERYARIFFKQAVKVQHVGPEAYDELFNEAYVIAKNCKDLRAAPINIKWALIRYLNLSTRAKNLNKDERNCSFLRKDSCDSTAFNNICMKEERELLMKAIGKLTTKEQYIIEYYFYRKKNLKEIAEIYNCSFQWISKLLEGILKKLEKEINGTAN